ncbi:Ubiquitin carboxyl-terminal hydrolase 15 [Labeo rohita]|uniref:Ubiquitin carboxyl-terminal hydrolase 15 n=1 Tax=Labeo rohita TaxID=84645 RepID=A0ABQ8L0G6_LABRO|nr:Ubiquitin carboxyl-terminal hydrolase 15 [Labeo rohita]
MAEGGAADVETQRGEIASLLKTPLRRADTWYLVDSHWFKQWKKYVGFDSWDKYQMGDQNVYPGPVDNSGLLKDGDVLGIKEHLIDELDYILLPADGWNKLLSWYGLSPGQEPIARKVRQGPRVSRNTHTVTRHTLKHTESHPKNTETHRESPETHREYSVCVCETLTPAGSDVQAEGGRCGSACGSLSRPSVHVCEGIGWRALDCMTVRLQRLDREQQHARGSAFSLFWALGKSWAGGGRRGRAGAAPGLSVGRGRAGTRSSLRLSRPRSRRARRGREGNARGAGPADERLDSAFGSAGVRVVEQGMFVKHCKVEVYLTELKLCEDSNMDNVETRLWNKYMSNTFEPLNKPDSTIQDAGLYQGQVLVIEQKNEDGTWPRGSSALKSSGASTLSALPKICPSSLANNHNSSFGGRNSLTEELRFCSETRGDVSVQSLCVVMSETHVSSLSAAWCPSGRADSEASLWVFVSELWLIVFCSRCMFWVVAALLCSSALTAAAAAFTGASVAFTALSNVCVMKNSSYSLPSYPPYSSYEYSDQGRRAEKAGLCGLSNLGNTCFMNSATQCLSNIPPLTEYFLKDKYQDELNEDNPLGMKGEIAKAYAELIKQLWSGKYSYVTPRPFKTQVGRFAPQFSGYQQQDSHELLAFLLDGLHEDLNRIRKKPYIQLKDADGRPDKVVAEEAWENHIKRNDSIIVDIFHGLFKSTLVCPVCAKISVTFDPFCYLTLPLPMKKERTLEVYLVWLDPLAKPTQYKLTVPKVGYISDLCASLSVLSGVPAEKMIVTDIYNHRFHRIFANNENLSSIMERDDIYVFEVAVNRLEDTDHVVIPVHLREKYKQSGFNQTSTPLFGQPFLLSVPRTIGEDKLYNLLLLRLCRFVRPAVEDEESEETYSPKHHSINGNATNGITEEGSPSEMETDEQDDESSQDQELPSENDNSQSEDSVGGDNELENGVVPENSGKGSTLTAQKKRLFTFQFNNMGKTDANFIKGEPRQIRFDEDHMRLSEEKLLQAEGLHRALHHQREARSGRPVHQQATKKLDLWSLPPVLVVHLKRFSYSRYMRDKLDSLVDFPLRYVLRKHISTAAPLNVTPVFSCNDRAVSPRSDLDMSEFLINPNAGPCRYDLIAVSNHYGGMGGGHYTAYAKNKEDDKWYNFDDSSVSPTSEDQIVRQDTVKGTGYFALDREAPAETETPRDEAGAAAAQSEEEEDEDEEDEDLNDNEQEEELGPNRDVRPRMYEPPAHGGSRPARTDGRTSAGGVSAWVLPTRPSVFFHLGLNGNLGPLPFLRPSAAELTTRARANERGRGGFGEAFPRFAFGFDECSRSVPRSFRGRRRLERLTA